MDQQKPQHPLVKFMLNHKKTRVFIFEFATSVFLTFMCLSLRYMPPYEDHPHDLNIFLKIYIALVVYVIICFSGPICGAYINPAISVAYFINKKKQKDDFLHFLSYVSSQILGCYLGILLSNSISGVGGPLYPSFPDGFTLTKDCVEQTIATFLLVTFIFILTSEDTTFIYDEAWTHLIIAVIYYFCLTYSRLGLLNPAIAIGLQLQGSSKADSMSFLAAFLVVLAQLLGAILSQQFFKRFYQKKVKSWKQCFQ